MAMNVLNQKHGKATDIGSDRLERIVVAVKAAKEIPKTAIAWALTHVAQPGDCVTLLVVAPTRSLGRRFWGFPRLSGDCANRNGRSATGVCAATSTSTMESCSQMLLQLRNVYDPDEINVKVKIVSGSPCGSVSAESRRIHASWVVFDRHLKNEEKKCIAELQCNIVAMRHSQAKVLRVHLNGSIEVEPGAEPSTPHRFKPIENVGKKEIVASRPNQGPALSSTSSPDIGTSFTCTEVGALSSMSSSDLGASPFSASECKKYGYKRVTKSIELRNDDPPSSESDDELLSRRTMSELHPWAAEILSSIQTSSKRIQKACLSKTNTGTDLAGKFGRHDSKGGSLDFKLGMSSGETILSSRNDHPGPPLCSICQHRAPLFGKPPRWFSYAELELATDDFSKDNFLAEGGFGSVYKGVLSDGQVVAIKQHKLASSQGDLEFSSEVEVLSCAQHRNVVMLIGYCVENHRRLLVYEYVCNGSLDSHLYGENRKPLEWRARQKIARGAARGLRYLHEECRVGCIVHRDMRPNNILITHDFEPLVGDFGLARWQPDGHVGADTRVVGTFGYLAPEYAQSGQITEKADVYSFGVVLVELVTGRKAVDVSRPKGQHCLTEWARPLLEEFTTDELVDPSLLGNYSEQEVSCMLYAASLCIRRDPNTRPRMSQVIRVLDGDAIVDPSCLYTPSFNAGMRREEEKHHRNDCGRSRRGRVRWPTMG